MAAEAPFRIGLRVGDVSEATVLYLGLGFEQVAAMSDQEGRVIMAILRRRDLQLVVDALEGLPFPDSDRERATRAGPRGLGVVIGLAVPNVDSAFEYCRSAGCRVTTAPVDAPWGERYAEVTDPYEYAWKLFQILPGWTADSLSAAYDSWFRDRR